MNLNVKSYKEISKYLNDKYYINFNISKKFNMKKEIKIKFLGFLGKYNIEMLQRKLDNEFIFKFEEDNPDYLI